MESFIIQGRPASVICKHTAIIVVNNIKQLMMKNTPLICATRYTTANIYI